MSTLNARLADPDYKYWVKATLCLQYVKGGLERFAEEKSQMLHDVVLKEVQKQDNIFIKGLCPDSKIEFNNVRKTWTVIDCNCQDCTRCIDVIKNQVVKNGPNVLDQNVQELHDRVLQELISYGNPSIKGICAGGNLRFNRNQNKWEVMYCYCNRCQLFVDEISKYRCPTLGRTHTTTFTFKQSNFNNSDIQQWHTEHWQLAKLFMNQGQDVTTTSPRHTDISGLLNFIDHCVVPRGDLQNTQNIEKVREGRNSIIHTCTMKLTEAEFLSKTQEMIDLLSDPKCMAQYKESQDAIDIIRKIRSSDFTITLDKETEVLQGLVDEVKKSTESIKNDIERLTTRLEASEQNALEITQLRADIEKEKEWTSQVISTLRNEIKDDKELQDKLEAKVGMLDSSLKEIMDQMQLMESRQVELESRQSMLEGRQEETEGRQVEIGNRQNKMESRQVEIEDSQSKMGSRQAEIEGRQDMVEGRLDNLEANNQQRKRPLTQVTEEEKAQKLQDLQQYLKEGYDDKLNVPVLSTCHGIPVSDIFAPVILTQDTETVGQEQGRGNTKKPRSYKSTIEEERESKKLSSYKALFFIENVLQKKICLLGKAGAGKTTFCQHLTDIWCNDKVSPQFDDAEVLKLFRYLFHVSCRFAESSESIFDMICNQLFCENDEMIKFASEVLKNKPDECLVIVDGIDEWKGSANKATGRRGDIPGLPSRKGLEDCVVLSTSRPERIHMLPTKLDKTCSVLELHGIEDATKLIRSILEKIEDPHPKESCEEFLSQIEESNMGDLIQFPLMLINALNIWDMNETLSSSMCVNYSNMVEGLFSRAKDANRIEEHGQGRRQETPVELPAKLPDCFLHADLCKQHTTLIINLGNLAFDLLFGDDQNSSLMFSEQQTRNYLTEIELKTCLAVGILSKAQTISRSIRKVASFSFCHKTFQEFLGALWLPTEQCNIQQIKSIDTLFDNKVFILFLCGLSPNAGDRFWQYIAEEVIEKDEEVTKVRLGDYGHGSDNEVARLQEFVLECIREARNADLEQHRQLCYFIPDIYIDTGIDERDITLINDLVEKFVADIKYVTLYLKIPLDIVKSMKKMQSAICISLTGGHHDRPAVAMLELPDQLKVLSIEQWDATSEIELPKYLTILTLREIYLSHSSIEEMFSCLRVSSTLRYLRLEDLSCRDHCGSYCCSALDLQRHRLLEKVELKWFSVKSVLLPGQGTIPLPLTKLTVEDIELSHSSIEELFSCLRFSSTLRYLHLEELNCRDHGDSCCIPALDLQRHHSLEEVLLARLSVESVLLPGQGIIPLPLTKLTVSYIKLSHISIEELCSCLRVLSTLQDFSLKELNCRDHGDSCCLLALDLQRHHSLEEVWLGGFSVKSVLLPGQGTIPSSLKRLTAKCIKLSHSGIEELFSCVRVPSTLRYLHLEELNCRDHGDSCCIAALDLQRHHSLEEVWLGGFSVKSVLLPGQGTIPLPLTKLTVEDIELSHSSIEELFSCLRFSSTLRYLHLEELNCRDHGDSCCIAALDLQRHHSLEEVWLEGYSVKSVLLPCQGTIPSSLKRLTAKCIKLSHSGIEELFSCVRVPSTLRYLHLKELNCRDHGDSCCIPALDLKRHHSLEEVWLAGFSVKSVLLPGQGTIPSSLKRLTAKCIKLSHSGIEELFSSVRVPSTLRYLYLWMLHCNDHGERCCLPALDLQKHHSLATVSLEGLSFESVLLPGQLERQQTRDLNRIPTLDIGMDDVYMSIQSWRSWLDSLPHLPYRLNVGLQSCNINDDHKSYISSCSHFTVTQDDDLNFKFETKQGQ